MNIVDKQFYNLINVLNNKNIDEIKEEIKEKFKNLPLNIKNSLESYFNRFPYWGILSIKDNIYDEIENRAKALKNHLSEFIWLYEHLEDYRSRYLLLAILNNWYNYDFILLENAREKIYPDYFDLDLVPFKKDSVLVDLGAYTFESTLSFIDSYGLDSYKKIYCYEITPQIYKYLEKNALKYKNIECRLKGVSDKKETKYVLENLNYLSANRVCDNGDIPVELVTLDEDILENITHIKMDIEGYEKKALQGSYKHIMNDHPILLISVYHNYEDIWKIPKMIMEMRKDYKLYLRYHGNNLFPTEVTLIAIPN